MRHRAAFACIFLAVATLIASVRGSRLVQAFELKTLDFRFSALASPLPKDPGIALLLLDQQSLDSFEKDGTHWPWPRGMYEAVVSYCKASGARAVVFDSLFTSFSSYGREDDQEFAKALKAFGTTALAMETADRREGDDIPRRFELKGGSELVAASVVRSAATAPTPILRDATRFLGDVTAAPDADGVFRRVALVSKSAGRYFPSLAAAAVLSVSKDRTIAARPGGLRVGDYDVPLHEGRMLIRYHGASPFPAYPLGRVIRSWMAILEKQAPDLLLDSLKGKLVIVGYSAPGLKDIRPTPVSSTTPGTEVVAGAAANILTGDFLRPAPPWVSVLLVVLAALAGATGAPGAAAAAILLAGGAALVFKRGVWIETVAPQLSLWLSFAATQAYGYAVEGRKKREIQSAFSRYLAPEVVAEIAEDPSKLKLGGERRELTCYFSDIEGFTTISEGLAPDRLTYLMNRYLGEMTDTVLESKGTLDKYIGDAVMAFWGAPVAMKDHALTACKVAIENQRKCAALSKVLEAEGFPPIRARIGLNSGQASVGNMGSAKRFSYTALGDDINLASRLEGANKAYGTYAMISESTKAQAGDAIETRELDAVKVKGKSKAVKVYELLGLKGQIEAARLEKARRFEAALAFYRGRRFEKALEAFEALAPDKAAKLYVERCKLFIKDAPAESWDGTFALTEK